MLRATSFTDRVLTELLSIRAAKASEVAKSSHLAFSNEGPKAQAFLTPRSSIDLVLISSYRHDAVSQFRLDHMHDHSQQENSLRNLDQDLKCWPLNGKNFNYLEIYFTHYTSYLNEVLLTVHGKLNEVLLTLFTELFILLFFLLEPILKEEGRGKF